MARYSIIKRQRKYYKDDVEVPSSSITDFGSYKYFKNVVTTKYWKEITTGGRELAYAAYKTTFMGTTGYMYAKAPIGSDMAQYMYGDGYSGWASDVSQLKKTNGVFIDIQENTAKDYALSWTRDTAGDLYIDTTVTEIVEGTPEDYTYTTEEVTPVEVTADDDYDFTEFVPSTQYDYHVDNNKLYIPTRRRREYYKYQDWEQPVLTANGTLGGDSFAVSSSSNYSGWNAFNAFDGVLTGNNGWSASGNSFPQHIIFYNPVKILVSNINIMNYVSKDCGFTAGNIYGSDNGASWVLISSFTNDVITKGATWDIDLASNKSFYKYHKIEITAGSGFASNNLPKCQEITITAKTSSKSTEADYDYYVDSNVAYDLVYKPYEVISQTFNVSSELQTYVVPEGVDKVNVVCVASRGATGSAVGGNGGSVKCVLSVMPNQTLYITVGGIPSSAGVPSYNASDIRIFGTELENRIIVAGGGGSGAWKRGSGVGGAGGGLVGQNGASSGYTGGGGGGTQSAGGAGGSVASVGSQWSSYGGSGSLGMGGTSDNHSNHYAIGGVGGAGYYGGGGGGGIHTSNFNQAAGGGGGSSYTDETLCENVVHLQGINNGEGYVKISYIKELKQ